MYSKRSRKPNPQRTNFKKERNKDLLMQTTAPTVGKIKTILGLGKKPTLRTYLEENYKSKLQTIVDLYVNNQIVLDLKEELNDESLKDGLDLRRTQEVLNNMKTVERFITDVEIPAYEQVMNSLSMIRKFDAKDEDSLRLLMQLRAQLKEVQSGETYYVLKQQRDALRNNRLADYQIWYKKQKSIELRTRIIISPENTPSGFIRRKLPAIASVAIAIIMTLSFASKAGGQTQQTKEPVAREYVSAMANQYGEKYSQKIINVVNKLETRNMYLKSRAGDSIFAPGVKNGLEQQRLKMIELAKADMEQTYRARYYFISKKDVPKEFTVLAKVVDTLLTVRDSDLPDDQKLIRIYKCILDNLHSRVGADTMDFKRYVNTTIDIFNGSQAACAEVSCAVNSLLRAAGYETSIMHGIVINTNGDISAHVWLSITLSGKSYTLEPTWYYDAVLLKSRTFLTFEEAAQLSDAVKAKIKLNALKIR
jgi:hypothetical protein